MKEIRAMKHPLRREAGFSIIELMISITLGLVILAALTTFFVQTSQNRREMDRQEEDVSRERHLRERGRAIREREHERRRQQREGQTTP